MFNISGLMSGAFFWNFLYKCALYSPIKLYMPFTEKDAVKYCDTIQSAYSHLVQISSESVYSEEFSSSLLNYYDRLCIYNTFVTGKLRNCKVADVVIQMRNLIDNAGPAAMAAEQVILAQAHQCELLLEQLILIKLPGTKADDKPFNLSSPSASPPVEKGLVLGTCKGATPPFYKIPICDLTNYEYILHAEYFHLRLARYIAEVHTKLLKYYSLEYSSGKERAATIITRIHRKLISFAYLYSLRTSYVRALKLYHRYMIEVSMLFRFSPNLSYTISFRDNQIAKNKNAIHSAYIIVDELVTLRKMWKSYTSGSSIFFPHMYSAASDRFGFYTSPMTANKKNTAQDPSSQNSDPLSAKATSQKATTQTRAHPTTSRSTAAHSHSAPTDSNTNQADGNNTSSLPRIPGHVFSELIEAYTDSQNEYAKVKMPYPRWESPLALGSYYNGCEISLIERKVGSLQRSTDLPRATAEPFIPSLENGELGVERLVINYALAW